MINVMILSSGLSDNILGEAVLSTCYILNRVPQKKLDRITYEIWKGYAHNLSILRV